MNKYKYKLAALVLIMFVIILSYLLYKNMHFNKILNKNNVKMEKINTDTRYMNYKGRCFDCEKQLLNECGPSCVWRSQQSKSFDSEREATNYGASGFLAKTIKYY